MLRHLYNPIFFLSQIQSTDMELFFFFLSSHSLLSHVKKIPKYDFGRGFSDTKTIVWRLLATESWSPTECSWHVYIWKNCSKTRFSCKHNYSGFKMYRDVTKSNIKYLLRYLILWLQNITLKSIYRVFSQHSN